MYCSEPSYQGISPREIGLKTKQQSIHNILHHCLTSDSVSPPCRTEADALYRELDSTDYTRILNRAR